MDKVKQMELIKQIMEQNQNFDVIEEEDDEDEDSVSNESSKDCDCIPKILLVDDNDFNILPLLITIQ